MAFKIFLKQISHNPREVFTDRSKLVLLKKINSLVKFSQTFIKYSKALIL